MAKSRTLEEYLLVPYGSLTDLGYRFVAEMILNKDGDEIVGVYDHPGEQAIDPNKIGAVGKIYKRSSGIWITDIKILGKEDESTTSKYKWGPVHMGKAIEKALDVGYVPKAIFSGTPNKKLLIVMDCKFIGFYMGKPGMLKKTLDIG